MANYDIEYILWDDFIIPPLISKINEINIINLIF